MGKFLATGMAALLSAGVVAAAGPTGSGSKALAQATEQAAVASGTYIRDPDPVLRLDILEAKRVGGGALMIRWRVINPSGAATGLVRTEGQTRRFDFSGTTAAWNQNYFIDPAENKKYHVLRDSGGSWIGDISSVNLDPGQQRLFWAKFPAPPASSASIAVHLDGFEPILDVPISQ